MRNEDAEVIFRVGAEYGIVNVLGCARKARTGLSIGGPEATGAANIYTAVVEQEHLETYPSWVREEIRKMVLRIRWQDDLVMVVDKSAPDTDRLKSLRGSDVLVFKRCRSSGSSRGTFRR